LQAPHDPPDKERHNPEHRAEAIGDLPNQFEKRTSSRLGQYFEPKIRNLKHPQKTSSSAGSDFS
jgi:hypothetical protein